MQRNFKTSHQGVAAYLVSAGYTILNMTDDKTKAGRPVISMEFDINAQEGKALNDDFFNGETHGEYKNFYDAVQKVRQALYDYRAQR